MASERNPKLLPGQDDSRPDGVIDWDALARQMIEEMGLDNRFSDDVSLGTIECIGKVFKAAGDVIGKRNCADVEI